MDNIEKVMNCGEPSFGSAMYGYRKWIRTTLMNSGKYTSRNRSERMTPKLVRNMTDSDLLDMHYFLTEDDDLDDDEFEEGFHFDFFTTTCFIIPVSNGHF